VRCGWTRAVRRVSPCCELRQAAAKRWGRSQCRERGAAGGGGGWRGGGAKNGVILAGLRSREKWL
jgi:hypothetical protein